MLNPLLSLGISPCPNDVFIFSGLLLNQIDTNGLRVKVDFEDVETLNTRAQNGELDVVKISYANYMRCSQHYDLLPCGGALGRGVGPLLLVNTGVTRTDNGDRKGMLLAASSAEPASCVRSPTSFDVGHEILVPGANTTANFLLDFYANLNLKTPLQKRFLPFDALYEELRNTPGAQGVVIHEKRFTYEQDGLTLVQDLGEFWEQQTGYAIPLGALCVRRSLGLAPALTDVIRRSLRWANTHYEDAFALCRHHAQDLTQGVIEAHIHLYVNDYSEELGRAGEPPVRFFLDQQQKIIFRQD